MWKATESAWVSAVEDARRAGHGAITLPVPHLEKGIAALATRGFASEPIDRIADTERQAIATDPDSKRIALIEWAAHSRWEGLSCPTNAAHDSLSGVTERRPRSKSGIAQRHSSRHPTGGHRGLDTG